MKNFFLKITSAVLCLAMFSSCASSTLVRTNDPDASIYIDGEYRGKGAITQTDQKIVGSTTHVMLKKNGCAPANYSFARNEEVDVGAIVGGIFVLVPFLWIMKYKPEHYYEYSCSAVSAK